MAQLNEHSSAETQTATKIPAASQLLAVAWLRWRIFANGFRRRQAGPRKAAGLIVTILLRLVMWPIFAMVGIAPAIGAGFFAFYTVSSHHAQGLAAMLAALALLWQFVALNGVNIAASAPTFEPSSLLRFPLRFPRYLVLRLLLGLLTPSTIVGCLALLATAIGITLADTSLGLAAFVVLAVYAALNIFLSRAIAVWLERWLATRRAREIFGVLMALVFVSFQAFNLNRGGSHSHAASRSWLLAVLHASSSFFRWLPPGFASGAILQGGNLLARLLHFVALLASTALIFAALALRLHKQFLGEYLSEGAPPRRSLLRSSRPIVIPPTRLRRNPHIILYPARRSTHQPPLARDRRLSAQGVDLSP
ncbi:MAG TPA: hypothetical protein VGU23_00405 [Acidobacteriaceae bacterium]|nr:hypothetical protein [Acidobacteriaceae bacterium]